MSQEEGDKFLLALHELENLEKRKEERRKGEKEGEKEGERERRRDTCLSSNGE